MKRFAFFACLGTSLTGVMFEVLDNFAVYMIVENVGHRSFRVCDAPSGMENLPYVFGSCRYFVENYASS